MGGLPLRTLAFMLNPSHVLIYGKDVTLVDTRGWILARAGFMVHCVMTADEAERMIREHWPEVLILCHTLSTEDCSRVKQIEMQGRPSMKTLVLSRLTSGCNAGTASAVLAVPPDPLQLITTVQQLAHGDGHTAEGVTIE